ncbi:MAG: zinc-dependent metalloprotease [Prevotella sp.]|nr:zinc-dependent metalloprotease [Prevotella sp.]
MNKTLTTIVAVMLACTTQANTYHVAKADTLQKVSVEVDTLKAMNNGHKRASKKEEKKETEYEKLMKKGGAVRNGLFGVRHIDNKYYFEVPDSMLGRYILLVTRLTAVPQNFGRFAGEEISHSTVYLERRDTTQLMVRQYVLSHVADDKDNIARTLEQSTVDPIVRSFKIIGRNKEDDNSLIEVTSFLTGDSHLTSFESGSKGTLKVGGLNKELTFLDTIKVFPTNIEVATTRTYGSSSGRSEASKTGAMTMAFNTSIVLLPKEPMRKRLWDERIGYFVNNYVRFSDQQHKTQHESFISRYRLVPKNKKKYLRGELTEPEKQIVYYIDPATPKKWIPYLIQGIKDWNVAFEAAGFKNAITAKVLPEDDPNISLEDARYSVLRYLPSETENAYGPRIVDPRSGEIIEAHICWYHNVMNLLTKWYMTQCGAVDKRAQTMHFDDKLMGELIRFVSSHEVGHSLGLRHNMGASFATPVEKLRDKAWVEAHGHTASIMDYARFNYVAQPEDGISEKGLFPRINDYDKWAIKWGYQWRPEFKDEYEEKEQLMTETTQILKSNPRLWFGGEGRNEDARAQTEDLGDNSVKASEYGIKNLKRIMLHLPEWTHQKNDQYEDLREMYNAVRDQFNRYVNHVAKNIGSRYSNNMPGRTPVEFASPERQKQAIAFIGQQVFEMPEWLYPTAIASKTATDVASTQLQMQSNLLTRLMTPLMLNNIASTDYQLDAYLADLKATVWKPIGKSNDLKAKARRQLQRSYVQNLNSILNPSDAEMRGVMGRYLNSDASLYVLMNLEEIEKYCQQQMKESSGLNALHYEDILRQLRLIRERRTTVK